jgi:RNA-directed DNA polymerase
MCVHGAQDHAFIQTQIIHGLDEDRQHARDQAIDAVGRVALLSFVAALMMFYFGCGRSWDGDWRQQWCGWVEQVRRRHEVAPPIRPVRFQCLERRDADRHRPFLVSLADDRQFPHRPYIERWLKAPVQMLDGTMLERTRGTPQGGVISPLLANLFLHYVFDMWMQRQFDQVPFERYADDVVCHCRSQSQAESLIGALGRRFAQCGLELHPLKTRVVYCKDADRRGNYAETSFDFLGYTFRPRLSKNRWGKTFVNFSPAMSAKAGKAIRQEVRNWNLQNRSDKSLLDLAHMFNAKIRGWVNYYGAFYKSELYPTLRQIDRKLVLWLTRKHKRLHGHRRRASHWLARVARKETHLFAHWSLLWGQASVGRAG